MRRPDVCRFFGGCEKNPKFGSHQKNPKFGSPKIISFCGPTMQCIQTDCVASAEVVTSHHNDDTIRGKTMLIVTTSEAKHELPDTLMLNSRCENTNGDKILPSFMVSANFDCGITLPLYLHQTSRIVQPLQLPYAPVKLG